jgi:hypothetical protein
VTSVSKETRASINEAILNLEKMNPTEDPADSSLLNGVWTLRYAGGYDDNFALQSPTRQLALFAYSGGYSPGLFALSLASSLPSGLVDVGELEIGKSISILYFSQCGCASIFKLDHIVLIIFTQCSNFS